MRFCQFLWRLRRRSFAKSFSRRSHRFKVPLMSFKRSARNSGPFKFFLVDAERKQVTDQSVRLWLSKLKGIAHDIENVVDDWHISGLDQDDGSHYTDEEEEEDDEDSKARPCLPSPYACFDRTVSRYKVAVEVKEIRKRLDEICGDKLLFSFSIANITASGQMAVEGGSQQRPSDEFALGSISYGQGGRQRNSDKLAG